MISALRSGMRRATVNASTSVGGRFSAPGRCECAYTIGASASTRTKASPFSILRSSSSAVTVGISTEAMMTQNRRMTFCEIRDVAPGLWIWRLEHPEWRPALDWDAVVTSTCVESRGEVAVLDPLAPPDDATNAWDRLERTPPTVAVVLKPDHVRDVDLFARWFGARAFGPDLFFAGDAPKTKLELVLPGDELPGGLRALYDGRLRVETPLYLPGQRAVVFAD